jgi:transcriptional regulator with XRE-family HTH domain
VSDGTGEATYSVELGNRIRIARKSQEMTLAEVAEQVGVTRSFLSQVERGVVNPSVTTLRRVAQVLRVPLFILLAEDEFSTNALVKESERRTIVLPHTSLTYQLLSPDLNRKIEMVYSKIEVGCVSCEEPVSHPGEECVLMLKGKVRIEVGSEVFIVDEGDSLYFDCGQPHRLTNIGDVTAEMVSAITPPSF